MSNRSSFIQFIVILYSLLSFASAQKASWESIDLNPITEKLTLNHRSLSEYRLTDDGKYLFIVTTHTSESNLPGICQTFRLNLQTLDTSDVGRICPTQISYDGKTIAGYEQWSISNREERALFWREKEGLSPIGYQTESYKYYITDMSDSGDVVVGYEYYNEPKETLNVSPNLTSVMNDENGEIRKEKEWPIRAFIHQNGKTERLERGTRAIAISADGKTILFQKNGWKYHEPEKKTPYAPDYFAWNYPNYQEILHKHNLLKGANRSAKLAYGVHFNENFLQSDPDYDEKPIYLGLMGEDQTLLWIEGIYPIALSKYGKGVIGQPATDGFDEVPSQFEHNDNMVQPFIYLKDDKVILTGWTYKYEKVERFRTNKEIINMMDHEGNLLEGYGFYLTEEEELHNQPINRNKFHCLSANYITRNNRYLLCDSAKNINRTLNNKGITHLIDRETNTIQKEYDWLINNKFVDQETVRGMKIKAMSHDGNVRLIATDSFNNAILVRTQK